MRRCTGAVGEQKCTCGYQGSYTQVPYVKPSATVLLNVTSQSDDHIWTRTVHVPMLTGSGETLTVEQWCIDIGIVLICPPHFAKPVSLFENSFCSFI